MNNFQYFEAFIPALEKFAYSMTKCKQDADDLFQECMIKLLQCNYEHKSEAQAKSYAFLAMKNTYITQYTRGKKQTFFSELSEGSENNSLDYLLGSSYDLERQYDNEQTLNEALEMLTDKSGQMLLRYVEGYKYKDIAKEMNMPIGTVKNYIHRKKKELCLELREETIA